ncbi:neocarzinostatin apoprotein domain-containing protein [Actinomadura sp. 7K534]|uniref:neocarzinostatin apoprotein domain-containing protein n=1 Tax=Actinomadura sp. 7K534 TaxID=2530366 RepID=UPI0014049BBC|nr:neocarzinostatin apoprotein domain-containing protein [Actinomadura sp. 7K534]
MIPHALAALALSPLALFPLAAGTAAAPELHVSRSADLTPGETITVTGTGFRPGLKAVAVGLCREGYTNGLKDCDLGGGSTFVNVDAEGRLPEVRLKARPEFSGIDCMTRQCVIGAGPLPGTVPDAVYDTNTAVVRVGFKGSSFKGGAVVRTSAAPAAATGPGTGGPSTPLWAATVALLVLAGGVVTVVQRRSR